jgi:hypothetical protein
MRLWRMVRVEKHYVSKGGRDCPRIKGKQMIRRIIDWIIDRLFKDEKDWDQ